MHAETPRLADKTIVFSEHEVFKVVVMVTRYFVNNIFTNKKSPKNITFNHRWPRLCVDIYLFNF